MKKKNLYTRQVENLKRRLGQKWVSRWTENPKGRSRQKLGIKAYDYVLSSCHLPTRRRLVHQQLSAPHRSSSPTSETGAIKGCPSNPIALSSKVPRQVQLKNITRCLNSPENESKPVYSPQAKLLSNLKEVGYPPADLNIPQCSTCILNKRPR